jgi:hypothetical protein
MTTVEVLAAVVELDVAVELDESNDGPFGLLIPNCVLY